jgi:hypothetical protein
LSASFRWLPERFGFGDKRWDQLRLFLEQLFHFNALFLGALSTGEFGDLFPQLGWDCRGGASSHFLDVTIEKLQQNFEIIIHG